MNRLETEIYNYLSYHKLSYLKTPFIQLTKSGVSGQSFKKLKEYLKSSNTSELENKIKELCDKYQIPYEVKKYIYPDKTNKERQKEYHAKKLQNGFKRISFYLEGKTLARVEKIQQRLNMSYSELFEYLINKENSSK